MLDVLVANFDYAGTNRFCSHILAADDEYTICGVHINWTSGDWQETGEKLRDDNVGCLRCKKVHETNLALRAKLEQLNKLAESEFDKFNASKPPNIRSTRPRRARRVS